VVGVVINFLARQTGSYVTGYSYVAATLLACIQQHSTSNRCQSH